MRRREKPETNSNINNDKKNEVPDIPKIVPLRKVIEEINGMGIWNSDKMLTIIDSQILARKLEIMGFGFKEVREGRNEIIAGMDDSKLEEIKKDPEKKGELNKAIRLMREIADLTEKGRDIKSTTAFIDTLGTS